MVVDSNDESKTIEVLGRHNRLRRGHCVENSKLEDGENTSSGSMNLIYTTDLLYS